MQVKSVLASALVVSSALAASNSTASVPSSCSISSTATATAQSDLDKFAGCSTIAGNLLISGDLGSAALSNVQKINGDLTIFNATNLYSFSADSLVTITGDLTLQQLTLLASANLPSLSSVNSITLITLPAIETFTSNLKTANTIYVSDTTLESVDAFASLKSAKSFNINNNRQLTSVISSLESVSDALEFSYNGDAAVVAFDSLVWANNITLRDVASASFSSLQNVNASLGIYNNTLTNFTLANLTKVGASLSFTNNNELTSLDCSNLTSVGGGFVIANNTDLATIDGFSSLQTVGGAIQVIGNYSSLDLSSLKSVRGGADFESSASNFTCSALNKLSSNGAIQGDSFVCKNGATSTSVSLSATSSSRSSSSSGSSASSSSSSTKSSSSSSSKSSKGAAVSFAPASNFMGAVAAVALALL
ncbi:hypothetical protein TPHA_0A03900 [Tetrapisispora phaffii CBS 4417]|uniref:Receptor L-domain domain-containing protein n=1 Tax=Tetrapisispora phaffii (strain ATCC 24235 / CBS 4417 / NBRC 1672 / NRRL Y-8282 / UCD 70-5) TaxID=1071381 RepID=G8BNI8_TETPH|nr:hypothetical protein TPHA_0A03900 [Tetrapisispora phaffii CBS 4417]CCE61466.1 hypothetical protein TPHA_0A03900 [Tetrapisispora phaffii CBS 4417]